MNLYEILEVNENASEETINKIYKIQAKKYHPDLQKTEKEKLEAEEKMKKINEAYYILSNEQKRKEYDEALEKEREIEEQKIKQEIINNMKQYYENTNQVNNSSINTNYQYTKQQNNEEQKKYTKADYIKEYKKRLRMLKFQLIGKNIKESLKALAITLIIILIIWFFPPTHNFLVKLYEENIALQTLVKFFGNFINAIKESI